MEKSIGDEKTTAPGSKSRGHTYALRPGEVLGQYKIIKPLGAGGMGEVYEAENTVNRKRVALKVLSRSAMGGTSIDRFRIESRVMMDLRHLHIVQVHHAGEERGLYYLTMDLVLGQNGEPYTLEDVVREEGRGSRGEGGKREEGRGASSGLPEARVRDLALQVCSALEHAHAKGLVHRDLKPANVLIAEDGTLRVSDFGLAKVVGEDYLHSMIERSVGLSMQQMSVGDQPTLGGRPDSGSGGTSTHALLGTYDYMSPEQKAGGEISVQTDIFAFGVMLYRMLTGEKPEGRWKPPSKFGLSKRWDSIVERCMERYAADRYPSIVALQSAIEQLGRGLRLSSWLAIAALIIVFAGIRFRAGFSQNEEEAAVWPEEALVVEDALDKISIKVRIPNIQPEKGKDLRLSNPGMLFKWIPPGRFMMGSTKAERIWAADPNGGRGEASWFTGERDPFRVNIAGFWLGETPVTVGQWKKFVADTNYHTDAEKQGQAHTFNGIFWGNVKGKSWRDPGLPGYTPQDNHPVVCISWEDAMAFCHWLTKKERDAGYLPAHLEYRLPGEAEWEYAARGGREGTRFWWGDEVADGRGRLNIAGTEQSSTGPGWADDWGFNDGYFTIAPVNAFGARGLNDFGLADMLGNVWEWCYDGYDNGGPHPTIWQRNVFERVLRGGSFGNLPGGVRCAYRGKKEPTIADASFGFRVALGIVVR
jgi:sulfatase modifying factor 1